MAFAKRNQKSKNLQRNTNEILNANEMVENYSPGSPTPKQKTKTNRGNPLRQGVQFNSVSNMLKELMVRNFGSPTKKNKRQSVNMALKNKAKKK